MWATAVATVKTAGKGGEMVNTKAFERRTGPLALFAGQTANNCNI